MLTAADPRADGNAPSSVDDEPPVVAPPTASFGTSSDAVRPTTSTSFVVELEQPIFARAESSES